MVIYVDNLFIINKDKKEIKRLKAVLNIKFKMINLGPYYYYLGIYITYNYITGRWGTIGGG